MKGYKSLPWLLSGAHCGMMFLCIACLSPTIYIHDILSSCCSHQAVSLVLLGSGLGALVHKDAALYGWVAGVNLYIKMTDERSAVLFICSS